MAEWRYIEQKHTKQVLCWMKGKHKNKMFWLKETMYDSDAQLQVGPRNTDDALPGCIMLRLKCRI
jgi:hypothetical protein